MEERSYRSVFQRQFTEVPIAEDEMALVISSQTKTFQQMSCNLLLSCMTMLKKSKRRKKLSSKTILRLHLVNKSTEEEQVEETEKQQVENESSDDGESEEQDESDWFTDDDPMEREPKMPEEADLGTPSYEYDETESVTDAALRESLESMVDDSAKEWVYISPIPIWIKSLFLVLKFRKR